MTDEQMQFLAKAATDSYFSNMDVNERASLMRLQENYIEMYFRTFDIAKKKKKKLEEQKRANAFSPFGEEGLRPVLK